MHHAVRRRSDKQHSERQRRYILLERDALVHRHKGVVLAVHTLEKVAVLDPHPATTDDGVDGMAAEDFGEV